MNTRKAIINEAHQSGTLMICRDLANRSKHFKLRDPNVDAKLFAEAEVDIRESMDGSESTSVVVLWDYIIELDDSFPRPWRLHGWR